MKIVVVDYGMGNLFSVRRALEVAGGSGIEFSADPAALAGADRVVLPGVGAFADGMAGLSRAGFIEALQEFTATGRPLLGICLGMQMLMQESAEFGTTAGLGLIPGKVVAIERGRSDGTRRKLPSIGWAPLQPGPEGWQGSALDETPVGAAVYFLHSFHAQVMHTGHMLASYDYEGMPVTAAVRRDNVTGMQFHPEKSGPVGLGILRRFVQRG